MAERKTSSTEKLDLKKRALIEGLRTARQAVLNTLEAIPPDRLEEPFLGTWSAGDLLAHLVGWDYTNLQAIREILAGQFPSFLKHYDKEWRSCNAQLVAQYGKTAFSELLADAHKSHAELEVFLESQPAQDLVNGKARNEKGRTVTIRNLLQAEASDERQHAEQVNTFAGRADA